MAQRRTAAGPVTRSETAIQMDIARFLRAAWPADLPWWHTPNGELRDRVVAGKLKAMGVRPGVWDLAFILPDGVARFIEVKSAKGTLSPDQKTFKEQGLVLGCRFAVARSDHDVEAIITAWLAEFGRAPIARMMVRPAP